MICFLSLVLDIALTYADASLLLFCVWHRARAADAEATFRPRSMVDDAQVLLWKLLHLKSLDELSWRSPGSIGTWILGLCHK